MGHQSVKTQIEEIMTDRTLDVDEQIRVLEKMRDGIRAEMRAATEGGMVEDPALGDDLKHIDEALEELDEAPDSIEDSGAATL